MKLKLDNQTLAELFQQHTQAQKAQARIELDTLFAATEASDRRITLAEKLAEDRTACESLRLANALKPWAETIAQELEVAQSASTPWWRQAWQPARWLVAGCALAALALMVAPQWHQLQPSADHRPDAFFAGHFDPATPSNDRIFQDHFKAKKTDKDKPLFKARFEGKSTGQA